MALTIKLLGFGELTSAVPEKELLVNYTNATGKCLLVKNVLMTNTGVSGDVSVELYVKRNGTGTLYYCAPKPVVIPAGGQAVLDTELTLLVKDSSNRELLWGKKTGSNTISFVVNGVDRDL